MFKPIQRLSIAACFFMIVSGCSKGGASTPNDIDGPDIPTPPVQANVLVVDSLVKVFMDAYNVPGLSLAITKGEKLVYAKAYGLADKEKNQKADTSDLYRTASLSKQITAVAVMKLLDEKKVSLDATVFGTTGLLGTTYGTQPYGPNITAITVRQLLLHTSGGWGNSKNDPMFTNPATTMDALISNTLNTRPLEYASGTHYDYSNFGYCLLGRIIEKITGQTYEEAVKSLVLTPMGITSMKIGGNTLAERLPKEVKYYGQSGEDPYIYNIRRMDAHGGWVASAKDLARFLVYVDGFTVRPDVITSETRAIMVKPSTANNFYATGWAVNGNNYYHTGSLPGTATEQARTSQGYNFVILTNTRTSANKFWTDLDQLFWRALDKNPAWQDIDQFK